MMITDRSTPWRKSSLSNDSGGECLEVACVHDAPWRKSSRSANNGECVEAARVDTTIAIRDSKLPTSGDFPVLTMTIHDWTALLNTLHD